MNLHEIKLQVLLLLHGRRPRLQEFASITLNSLWISAFGSYPPFNLAGKLVSCGPNEKKVSSLAIRNSSQPESSDSHFLFLSLN